MTLNVAGGLHWFLHSLGSSVEWEFLLDRGRITAERWQQREAVSNVGCVTKGVSKTEVYGRSRGTSARTDVYKCMVVKLVYKLK